MHYFAGKGEFSKVLSMMRGRFGNVLQLLGVMQNSINNSVTIIIGQKKVDISPFH